jgi:hypothetical protein
MPLRNSSGLRLALAVGLIWLLVACQPPAAPAPTPTILAPTSTLAVSAPTSTPAIPEPTQTDGLTPDQAATLNSLALVADYPLYTMHFSGTYDVASLPAGAVVAAGLAQPSYAPQPASPLPWGCSLFAALGDPGRRLYGRNFDWDFSPALLLFTAPPDGYASVSMVDIAYLGFTGDRAAHLATLPLSERQPLLAAPALPFDGMNERGLAVGMAAVPAGNMRPDPQKKTLGELGVIREILDHAATVEEAVDILGRYNIDMSSVPIHYLIASAAGRSALVEFHAGEMRVLWNEQPWHLATNFLVAATAGAPSGQCRRYDRLSQQLTQTQGRLNTTDAMNLLADVSQDNTQWSMVYDLTAGDITVVMGREYAQPVHTLHLTLAGR